MTATEIEERWKKFNEDFNKDPRKRLMLAMWYAVRGDENAFNAIFDMVFRQKPLSLTEETKYQLRVWALEFKKEHGIEPSTDDTLIELARMTTPK